MNFKKASGFSLLEVLIAFIIIMVSVVSLVSLYRFYIRSESNSAMLNGAMLLAESKLDDLRMFDSVATSDGVASYNDIDDNLGGDITAGDKTLSGYKYTLGWTVIDSDLTGFTIPVTTTIYPAKNVTVNVSWSDSSGETKSLSLTGVISKIVSADSEQIANSSKASGITPKVTYTPGVAPDVIAIDLGNGKKMETTKPIPDVATGNSGLVSTQFSTITYKTETGSSTEQALNDFYTTACECTYDSNDKSLNPSYPYTTDAGLLYWKKGDKSSSLKPRGTSSDPICNVCCVNHFDGNYSKFEEVYNKFSVKTDDSISPAKYRLTGQSYLPTYTSATSGNYLDSCRLMLIDGKYTPMPDWNLVKIIVMKAYFLSISNPNYLANLSNYQNYVKYIIRTYANWQKGQLATAWSAPLAGSPSILDFDAWYDSLRLVAGDKMAITMSANDVGIQLISRGIFIDIMSPDWFTNNEDAFANLDSIDLSKVPFFDVNMTLLTRWHPNNDTDSDDINNIKVLNEPMSGPKNNTTGDYYKDYYRRGYLSAGTNAIVGTYTVTVDAYKGNSSIAAYLPDPNKNEISVSDPSQSVINGTVSVRLTGNATKYHVRGRIYCFDSYNSGSKKYSICTGQTAAQLIEASSSPSCTFESNQSSTDSVYKYGIYDCPVDPNTSATAAFDMSVTGYNSVPSPATVTTTAISTITNGGCVVFYKSNIPNPNLTCPSSAP